MGLFLSTGLVSNVYVSLKEMKKAKVSHEKIVETFEKPFAYRRQNNHGNVW